MLRTGKLLDPLKGLCHGASPVGSRLPVAVSYRAAWSLPGPVSHRLVDVSFHECTFTFSLASFPGPSFSGHASFQVKSSQVDAHGCYRSRRGPSALVSAFTLAQRASTALRAASERS
jgi:hypothetical protein